MLNKNLCFLYEPKSQVKAFNAEILWYLFVRLVVSSEIWNEFQLANWPVRFIAENVHIIYKIIKPVITKKFAIVQCFNVCHSTDWF